MKVFEFAMKMEQDGKSLYERLAKEAAVPGLATIFTRLAADEQRHYEIFKALQDKLPLNTPRETTILDDARNVFEELLASGADRPGFKGDLDGYRYAMKIEADSARLYGDAAQKETDPLVQQVLRKVAAEEFKHFRVVENIFQFVNAPNQYLAWGEFSNLDEFHNFGRDVDR
jgi:rubrerythrin